MTPDATRLPGVRFEAIRSTAEALNLRTDVALFAGRMRRGPVAQALRIEGFRRFESVFGGLWSPSLTSYAVKGYFDNGGEVAWIHRLGGAEAVAASATWDVGEPAFAAALGLRASRYVVSASSPGAWGNRLRVSISVQRRAAGPQTLDVFVEAGAEPAERLNGLPCADLVEAIAARSVYVRFSEDGPAPGAPPGPGPLTRRWALTLANGVEADTSRGAYDRAVDVMARVDEPALFALPDLAGDLADDDQRREIIGGVARHFESSLDRLLVADLPESIETAAEASDWLAAFGERDSLARSVATYHPWIVVNDPLGTPAEPQRALPASGHVLGVYSRLDRERGVATSPANASIEDAVDLARSVTVSERAQLHELGVNPILCQSGRGLVIWGARMLGGSRDAPNAELNFVAHRRLVHRLIRAIRQVARPLVFEVNGAQTWFSLTRGATTVLLEAWRARALKGIRPEQAFRVRCDAELNTAEAVERGQVVCEISLALAVPMEFITVRIALSADGQLEVAEP